MGIVEGLADLAVPVDKLTELPGNPNLGDVKAVARSLARFGQRKPIVVRSSDMVVTAGNTTLRAARDELGWSHIAAVVLDDDEATSLAFALADNRTAELGDTDDALLASMIELVRGADPELLDSASFTDADLLALLGKTEGVTDPAGEWQGMPEFTQEDRESVFHTTIHFLSAQDAEAFFRLIERPRKASMWWPRDDGLHSSGQEAYVADDDAQS